MTKMRLIDETQAETQKFLSMLEEKAGRLREAANKCVRFGVCSVPPDETTLDKDYQRYKTLIKTMHETLALYEMSMDSMYEDGELDRKIVAEAKLKSIY